jgi:hypothetical protein
MVAASAIPFHFQAVRTTVSQAYGDHREEHTTLQDMAAVCCAIISTQNATDASTPTATRSADLDGFHCSMPCWVTGSIHEHLKGVLAIGPDFFESQVTSEWLKITNPPKNWLVRCKNLRSKPDPFCVVMIINPIINHPPPQKSLIFCGNHSNHIPMWSLFGLP